MSSKQDLSSTLQQQQKQSLHLTQRLIMSAHMQQAIRLLQLPLVELEPFIEEQVALNPLLDLIDEGGEEKGDLVALEEESLEHNPEKKEEGEASEEETEVNFDDQDLSILTRLEEEWHDHLSSNETLFSKRSEEEDKFKAYQESSICAELSLQDLLMQEARDSFEIPQELEIAGILIGYIDERGFLTTPLHEICLLHHLSEEAVQTVLQEIQTFEPYGVGAATIRECLLIQLRCLHKEHTLAYRLVCDYYEDLLHNHIPAIQKKLQCSYEQIQQAIEKDIAKLDLHPGMNWSSRPSQPIIPDVTLRQENDALVVEVDRERAPTLRLNHHYLRLLKDPMVSSDTRHFLKSHLFSARWLVRNLQQRYSTIERIAQSLAQKQRDFFMQPNGQLKPLTMKMLAEELGVHESTIARTVANKYLSSPRGLFPLRTFFTTKYVSQEGEDLSSKTIKDAILAMIAHEDKQHPLSDEKISISLKQKGIICARRTVAKYRLFLRIGNTQQRKKFSSNGAETN